MKKMRWLWMGSLILSFQIGFLGYSGSKWTFKAEANTETSAEQLSVPLSTRKIRVPLIESVISGAVAQVSMPETVTEPRVPSPKPEVTTTPPTPMPTSTPAPPPAPTATPPPSPPSVKPKEGPKGQGFVFNFDNADLYEVIRVMAEILKINYVIDPRVRGVANIHTAGQISAEDILSIFQTILKLNGATAVLKDNVYQIVPFGDAKKMYTRSIIFAESGILPEEKYMIQIIAVKFIPVAEVSKLIKPFLSDGADIVENPPNNIHIIGDLASNVKKSLDIIGLFDLDIFTDLRVRIYPILNADVTEVAKEMERIFSSFEVSTKSARGVGITFTPVTRINSLLVVSSIPNIFEKVEGWLKELDKIPAEGTKFSVFVYYVQNAKAKDLTDVLKQIFVTKEKKAEFKEKVVTPEQPTGQRSVRPPATPSTTTPIAAAKEEEGAVPEGEINIVVDEPNNALVIRAFARDYRTILDTIKKLDLYPKQVLIEIFLVSITLDDTNKFGLEWSTLMGDLTKGSTTYDWTFGMGGTSTPSDFTTGIRYAISATDKLTAAVNATAVDNKTNILSSPYLLASNNKEAKIQVGTSQPILTNTYTTSSSSDTTTVEGTIEYKDVGIIITLTPRVSDGGLVTMDLSIENSSVSTTKLGSLDNVPVFSKKTAKTTLSIMEAQTIVIGGLIEESKADNQSGVPWFSKIPILGALFGYQSYEKTKKELMLLLTPHVITDINQSNAVTRELKEKVNTIRKDLEKRDESK